MNSLIEQLIFDGDLVLFHNYSSGSFRDYSNLDNHGESSTARLVHNSGMFFPASSLVTVADSLDLRIDEGCILCYGDFKNIDVSNAQHLVEKEGAGGVNYRLSIETSGVVGFYDGSDLRTSTTSVQFKKLIAVNFSSGSIGECFLDGVSDGALSGSSTIATNTEDISIGNSYTGGATNYSKNVIYNVLILNRQLTDLEHAILYGELQNLNFYNVLHTFGTTYLGANLDDPTVEASYDLAKFQNIILDNSGNGYDGTVVGYPIHSQSLLGNSMLFDGVNDYIDIGGAGAGLTDEFTMSCWVKSTAGGRLISRKSGATTQWDWYIDDSLGYLVFDWGVSSAHADLNLLDDCWHFVSVVIDGASSQFYVDGVVDGSAFTPVITVQVLDTLIGAWDGASGRFSGYMVAPSIYSSVKDSGWASRQYELGQKATFKTEYGIVETSFDVESGFLGGSLFKVSTGSFKVVFDEFNDIPVKCIECVYDGDLEFPDIRSRFGNIFYGWYGYLDEGSGYAYQDLFLNNKLFSMRSGEKLIYGSINGEYSIEKYLLAEPQANFIALVGDSGVGQLSDSITLNSQTVYPTFVYRGGEADSVSGTWPAHVGETLSEAGAGSAISYGIPSLGNSAYDEAVRYELGKYHEAPNTTFADIGTEDFYIEFSFNTGDLGGTSYAMSKRGAIGTPGYYFLTSNTSSYLTFIAYGASAATVKSAAGTVLANQQIFVGLMYHKSGFAQLYINGVASGAAVDVSGIGSLSNAIAFKLGRLVASSDHAISYAALWKKASWLDSHLQPDFVAERFFRWSGIYPSRATGTATPTFTRASSAYAQKWNGSSYDLINVGAGIPRVDRVVDASGSTFEGMLIEPEATNLLTYSNDLDTGWTFSEGAAYCTGTAVETPVSGVYYQGIIGTASLDLHRVRLEFLATASTHVFSAIARRGNQAGLLLLADQGGQLFNLDTGELGTSLGVISDSGIEDLGGGNYLCWVAVDLPAGYITATVIVRTTANGAYIGDGSTVDLYAAFLQVELGTKPTSRIYANGATVTRAADVLSYDGNNITEGKGALSCEVLIGEHDPVAELSIFSLSDGGDVNESMRSYIDVGTNVALYNGVDSSVSQWSITGVEDIVDGDTHEYRSTWMTNGARQYVDLTLDGVEDTSCTIPTGIDQIDLAQDVSGSSQLNGRIRLIKIWPYLERVL